MNVLVLCTGQENGFSHEERFYPADKEIISALKKVDVITVTATLYDDTEFSALKKEDGAVIFNLCDGFTDGRKEAEIAEQLEKKQMHFTGNGSKALFLCMDKHAVKQKLQSAHLPVPLFFSLSSPHSPLPSVVPFPVIVKPAHEHGSVGIDEDAVVYDQEQLLRKVTKVSEECKQPLLIEQYVEGKEFCIPIIGNGHPLVLPILEIDYSEHFEDKAKILSYKAKWSKNSNAFKNTYSRIARLDEELRTRLEAIAKNVYAVIGMRGYGTVDVRVDQFGNIYIIDVNSNSYIAPESDLAKAAQHSGMSYTDLLEKIVHYAAIAD